MKIMTLAAALLVLCASQAFAEKLGTYVCDNSASIDAKEPKNVEIIFPDGTSNVIQIVFFDISSSRMRGVSMGELEPEESSTGFLIYPEIEQDQLSKTTYAYVRAVVTLDPAGTPSEFQVADDATPAHTTVFKSCKQTQDN